MKKLKMICGLFCILLLISSLMILFRLPHPKFVVLSYPGSMLRGIVALVGAMLCAIAAFGIHKRLRWTWGLGWLMLVLGIGSAIYRGATEMLRVKPVTPDRWLGMVVWMIGSAVVGIYFGAWWARQREFFSANHQTEVSR